MGQDWDQDSYHSVRNQRDQSYMERRFFGAKSFGTNQPKPRCRTGTRIKKEKKKVTCVRVQENQCVSAKKGWFLHPEQGLLTAGKKRGKTNSKEVEEDDCHKRVQEEAG